MTVPAPGVFRVGFEWHCASSGDKGRAALELCMAIYQSERVASRIELPLTEKESPLRLMIEERLHMRGA